MRSHQNPAYTYIKRNVYYFHRKIPKDLRHHYSCNKITLSLRTKSKRLAASKALQLAATLDDRWGALRWSNESILARFSCSSASCNDTSDIPSLTEAKELYLSLKGASKPKAFMHTVERATRYLIEAVDDKAISTYSRSDANSFRDHLLNRGLSPASAKKNISVIRAMLNFVTREHDLNDVKAFSSVFFDEETTKTEKRKPIPTDVIHRIQAECERVDDPARWLIALISDTGMRLSEAVGLCCDDIHLDSQQPYIQLVEHPWRRLKTRGSERVIPLVGSSLWAVQRAMDTGEGSLLFPKYCTEQQALSNSASAALNKWLKRRAPEGCVIHSFRHSMRDRLRAVQCPPDIIDRIGGWSLRGIGEGYGNGHPLQVLHQWMVSME